MESSPPGEAPKKRMRVFAGRVQKCGQCKNCLAPSSKRACLVNRPPGESKAVPRNRGSTAPAVAAASVLDSLPEVEPYDKAVPPHGVLGFKLPVEPGQRPRKWTRQWVTQPTVVGDGACWVLRWVPAGDPAAPDGAAPPGWGGAVAPRADAVPPDEPRLPPWADTTTLGASRRRALQALEAVAGSPGSFRGEGGAGGAEEGGEAGGVASLPEGASPPAAAAPKKSSAKPKVPSSLLPAPPGWLLCDVPGCGRSFEMAAQMKRHTLTHREKTFLCPEPGCGKAFGDATKLKRHQSVHDATRGLVCAQPGCGRIFTTLAHYSAHMKMHESPHSFDCPHPGCKKSYTFQYKLKQHLTIHRNNGDPEPPQMQPALAAEQGAGEEEEEEAMEE